MGTDGVRDVALGCADTRDHLKLIERLIGFRLEVAWLDGGYAHKQI
jgi:hypothetical protein